MRTSASSQFSALHSFRHVLAILVSALSLLSNLAARADQIEMQNGDRYVGSVVSLDTNTLVMRNDVLGTVRLPRKKVLSITFGKPTANDSSIQPKTNALASRATTGSANSNNDFAATVRQLNGQTNLIQQVQSQFLSGVGPEANNKFNELLNGLVSGRLTLGDLRNEAKSAADQLRALKKDLGDDSGFAVDGYLSILDGFLAETADDPAATPTNQTKTTAPTPAR